MSTPVHSSPSTPHPRHLLVRGVNWLGDAVMTTPALLRLREALPDTHITLLTHEKLAGLWHGHPAVNEVLTFGPKEGVFSVARRLRTWRRPGSTAQSRVGAGGEEGFEATLVLPNSLRSGLEVALARIPRRIGYAGGGRNWMLTQAVPWRAEVMKMRKRTPAQVRRLIAGAQPAGESGGAPAAASHHVFHYLHLAAALGAKPEPLAPLVAVSPAEVAAVRAKFNLPDGPLLGLNAGAEYGPAKRWPAENFLSVARTVGNWPGWGIVVLGGQADALSAEQLTKELAAAGRSPTPACRNLAGKTSLRELCAVFSACRVVLTNDTGPMHVAAAAGARVVALFGSTSPTLTGPGLPGDARHAVLQGRAACAPCFLRECPVDLRCLKSLTPAEVAAAVERAAR